ncbi:hypothetical protein AVEN_231444-1 [Araneus ventricosus]|uniref:Uncharacterized protein n=1 Tax=Araneus ventricosus TaxID=182803 RepID=A0A4Y2TK52_ARAVE|nr:hypothetical protein AVEN_231444-1 [Araneus ventricosus]
MFPVMLVSVKQRGPTMRSYSKPHQAFTFAQPRTYWWVSVGCCDPQIATIMTIDTSGGLERLPDCRWQVGPLKQKTIWTLRKCGREKRIISL